MILFIDDSDYMGSFIEGLCERKIKVDWAKNFYDATDSLDDDPGEIYYNAIILDLAMSNKGLPDKAKELADKVFPGWAFYKYVIAPNYSRLKEKTIFLSGFPENFKEKIGETEYKCLNVVTKGHNQVQNVIDMLKKLDVLYVGS